jgi:hypothetical protein
MAGISANAVVTSSTPAHPVPQAIEAFKRTSQPFNPRCQFRGCRLEPIVELLSDPAPAAAFQRLG